MADMNDLFFFGDDFDAILETLENKKELQEHFVEAADSVSLLEAFRTLFSPKNFVVIDALSNGIGRSTTTYFFLLKVFRFFGSI